MKTVLFCLILSCVIALPALSEVTKSELEKIQLIVEQLQKTVDQNFETNQKTFDRQNTLIIACFSIYMGVLVIGVTVCGIIFANKHNRQEPQNQIWLQAISAAFELQTKVATMEENQNVKQI